MESSYPKNSEKSKNFNKTEQFNERNEKQEKVNAKFGRRNCVWGLAVLFVKDCHGHLYCHKLRKAALQFTKARPKHIGARNKGRYSIDLVERNKTTTTD